MKNKKLIEILSITLIIIVLIGIGYLIYNSYRIKKEQHKQETVIDNYYNAEYLFNNSYIKEPSKVIDLNNKEKDLYMNIDKFNNLYIKYKEENNVYEKHIKSSANETLTMYYNNLNDDIYEFLALTKKGNIYYVKINLKDDQEYEFTEVSSNIKDIYVPAYDKKYVYINEEKDIKTNFIIQTKDNKLMYISKNENYVLKDNLKEKKPYFDYICVDMSKLCNKTIMYKTFKDNLIYNNKIITNEKGQEIIVKNIFASIELKDESKEKLQSITIKKLRKTDFIYTIYIIDKNDLAYKVEITNKTKIPKAQLISQKLVKELKYEKEVEIDIIYDDGTYEMVKETQNKKLLYSTIYDKEKKLIMK